MFPLSTRKAPNHSTATLDAFSTSITIGNISAISRPARSVVAVTSRLATANRSVSNGSRTKARTTRTPVICSRITRLTSSIFFCSDRKVGTSRITISPTAISRTGTADRDQPGQAGVGLDRHEHAADRP